MISAGHGQKNDKNTPSYSNIWDLSEDFFFRTIPLNWPVVQLDAFHQTLMVLISFHADQIFHGWFCSLLVHSHVDLLLVAHSYVCFCQIFNRGVTELDCSITFTELAVAQNDSAITVITTLWNCNGGDVIVFNIWLYSDGDGDAIVSNFWPSMDPFSARSLLMVSPWLWITCASRIVILRLWLQIFGTKLNKKFSLFKLLV